MSNVIFTKDTVTKAQLYTKIKTLLTATGWQNVSSKPVTDFDVLTSAGETGDKQLVLQLSDIYNGNSLGSTTSQYLMIRTPYSYIPGTAGAAGTFGRPADTWMNLQVFDTAVGPDIQCDLYYHVNKNRIIFAVEPPRTSGISPQVVYMGLSDESYINEIKSDGVMVASTRFPASKVVWMTSKPKEKTNDGYYLSTYELPVFREDTGDNTRVLFKMIVGNASEGVRCALDNVFCIINNMDTIDYTQTGQGDILITKDGLAKYRVFSCKTNSYGSWGYKGALNNGYRVCVALRIE